jgi:replicative DNA helicase
MITNGDTFENALPAPDGIVGVEPRAGHRVRRKQAAQPTILDRLPPHSEEMERGVLGCMMISPNTCIGQCMEKFTAGDDAFYDLRHQIIYANLVQMFTNQKPVDLMTLHQRLKDFDFLDAVGGIPYLNEIQDCVPSAANLNYYADIVEDKYLLRRMLQVCTDIASRAYDFSGEVDAFTDEAEREILAVRKMRRQSSEVGVKELVREALSEIERKYESGGAITGLATGLIDLDKYTDGLHPGEMTVLAAYPSIGKTSLAMNIAENIVLSLKQPVGVFSMEMTSVALVKRCLCSNARVNVREVVDGRMAESDFPRLTSAAGRIANAAIYFDDEGDLSIFKLRAKARRMWQKHGVKLIIIDYLQLMNASGGSRKVENRQQEIADISNGIKCMAKELNVPVLALSQLTETTNGPRLRGSADIGQDADGVWMLQSPKEKTDIKETAEVAPINLWIQKQRNGPRNVVVRLVFLKTFTRFESVSRVAEEDVPNYEEQFPT